MEKFEPMNAENLDIESNFVEDSYSNFRFLDIGKPDSKQIVKLEKKDPKKIADLIKKGVITQGDVDLANTNESYTPPSSVMAEISTLPFTDTKSFITYIQGGKFDNSTLNSISDALKKVSDGDSNGLSVSDIAISLGTFQGKAINSADAKILLAVANDKIATDFLKQIIALTPAVSTTTNSTTTTSGNGTTTTSLTTTTVPVSAKKSNAGAIIGWTLAAAVGFGVWYFMKHSNKPVHQVAVL